MLEIFDKNGNVKKIQEVEDTGWVKLNSVTFYRVKNGQCTINIFSANYIILVANQYTNVGILPKNIVPAFPIEFCPHFYTGVDIGTRGAIGNDGNIIIYTTVNAGYYGASVSYPI